MTKRSAENADLARAVVEQPTTTRRRASLRSTTRQKELERQRQEHETELEEARIQRATELSATPQLRAMPLVLTSGFLYKHAIRNAALTCKDWKSLCAENVDKIPDYCQVEIRVDCEKGVWPDWTRIRGLPDVIPSQEFAKTVFRQLCELKVAAEPTVRKKQKARNALPKWGIDFYGVHMHVWKANSYNSGGIYWNLCKHQPTMRPFIRGWCVRLDRRLRLWTWDQFQKWRKVYDGTPLWEWQYSDMVIAADWGGRDPVAAEAAAPAVPAPLPPPGPGRIDFYFQPRAS